MRTIYTVAQFFDADGNHVETVHGTAEYVADQARSFLHTQTADPDGQSEEGIAPQHLAGSVAFAPLDPDALEALTSGYATAALWADCMPPENDPDGETGGREGLELEPATLEAMRGLCARFMAENADDLAVYVDQIDTSAGDGGPWDYAGHDLRLTAGGHGAGFWDRDDSVDREVCDRLTAAAGRLEAESERLTPTDNGDGTASL